MKADPGYKDNPAENEAELDAMIDHATEQASSGDDPIPTDPPDWAEDLPSPDTE